MLLRSLTCAVVMICAARGSIGQLVINEIWVDDAGQFSVEYIELYSPTGASLDGLSVVVVSGNTQGQTSSIEYRRVRLQVDLGSSDVVEPNGYFLLGVNLPRDISVDRLIPEQSIPKGTQTIAVVRTQDIAFCESAGVCAEIDQDELTEASMLALSTNLIDSIAFTDGDTLDHVYFDAPVLSPTADGFSHDAAARIPNGVDTDFPADWITQDNILAGISLGDEADALSSPGAPNDAATGACCLSDGSCTQATASTCQSQGGSYLGDGTDCGSVVCPTPGDECLCETDGQPDVTIFDLLTFLDCWFAARAGECPQ